MQLPTISMDRQYCEPANPEKGGYNFGLLAQHIDGPSEVRLYAPHPLNTPLTLDRVELL